MRASFTYLILLMYLAQITSVFSQVTENDDFGVEITANMLSRYNWRGYELSHNDPVLMTYVNYSPKPSDGLTISSGIIFGLKNEPKMGDDRLTIDEFDLSVAYEQKFIQDKLTLSASLLFYKYTSDWTRSYYEDTKDIEVNLRAFYAINRYFIPYVSFFRGVDKKIKGNYLEVGFSDEFIFSEKITLTPKWYVGYSSQYEFHTDPKFTHVAAEIPLSYSYSRFTFEISGILVKPLEKALNGNRKAVFITGITAAYAF